MIYVFRIPPNGDTNTLRDAVIDGIDGAEAVSDDFVVGKSLVGAWLIRCCAAWSSRVEEMNTRQNRIGIFTRASSASVRKNV